MAGKVLATDLDGTLFFPKKIVTLIHKKNVAFLRKWVNDGNRLVLITSRTEDIIPRIKKRLGEDVPFDLVGADGTIIRVGEKLAKYATFDPEILKRFLLELRRDYKPTLLLLTSRQYSMIQIKHKNHGFGAFGYACYQSWQGRYREKCYKDDSLFYGEIAKGNACKLMAFIGINKMHQRLAYYLTGLFQKEYPDLDFAWLNQMIEVTPKGCNKATGLAFYLDYLGISKENVTVIGDSGNDVAMFDAFYEQSFCMAHAPLPIRKRAKHVVERVYELEQYLYPSADSITATSTSEKEEKEQ